MIKCEFENGNKSSLRHVVADVIVTRDDQVLLVKRAAGLLEGGRWALPGGFVDRDESVAGAAKREVMEETGWEVDDLELMMFTDSPERRGDDRQNVVFVYFGTGTQMTGQADAESTQQRWFGWEELPELKDMAFDHLEVLHYYLERVARRHPANVE